MCTIISYDKMLKRLFPVRVTNLIAVFVLLSLKVSSQSFSPTIINYNPKSLGTKVTVEDTTKSVVSDPFNMGLMQAIIVTQGRTLSKPWLFPFRAHPDALARAFDEQGSDFSGPSGISIRPSVDNSKTTSIFVEFLSIVPWNAFKIGFGSTLIKSDIENTEETAQDIAFKKLTSGGGNIVLNLNRPIIYLPSIGIEKKGFFVSNIDLTGFADIEKLNHDIYNPGWGALTNISFDYRLADAQITTRQQGNIFRWGINGRHQFNIFNERYGAANLLNNDFNNLSISSIGTYLGLAMFNINLSYNHYNKNSEFFKNKNILLRIDVIPVKF